LSSLFFVVARLLRRQARRTRLCERLPSVTNQSPRHQKVNKDLAMSLRAGGRLNG